MITLCIIGSGNVASHLASAFAKSGQVKLLQLYARQQTTVNGLPDHVNIIHEMKDLAEADLYLLAVSDNAIAEVSENFPFEGKLLAHTSGSVPLEAMSAKNRRAVFYPLQTFSKDKEVDFTTIPFCLEAENETDLSLLRRVASAISTVIYDLGSKERKALHVAAVFANNFVNHLYGNAFDICSENGIDPAILHPLIAETANKVIHMTPQQAQTGPAKRNDTTTIQAHLDFLKGTPKFELYDLLTQSIQNGEKL